jgi:hypothetical protein
MPRIRAHDETQLYAHERFHSLSYMALPSTYSTKCIPRIHTAVLPRTIVANCTNHAQRTISLESKRHIIPCLNELTKSLAASLPIQALYSNPRNLTQNSSYQRGNEDVPPSLVYRLPCFRVREKIRRNPAWDGIVNLR